MGKRGKNKGGGQPAAASEVAEPVSKPVEIEKAVEEVKKVEEKKPVEIKKTEVPKVEATSVPESTENAEGTLQKKKRNKKNKKKTVDENNVEEQTNSEPKAAQEKPAEPEKSNAEPMEKSETETIKKKRNRRKKTNQTTETTSESAAVKVEEESKAAIQEVTESSAATDTIKKKRNRNKKKTTNAETPAAAVAAEKPAEPEVKPVTPPAKPEATPVSESNAELNKKRRRKRNNASKMSIVDELKIKQEAEEQKAHEELKKEIKNREKLLEKIEMVLDARISDVSQAHSQQKLLGKISEDLSEIERTKQSIKASKAQEKAPKKDELVGKVQQVLDVTKKEIQNVQQQQAFVGLLEDELAKVKQNKEKYLKGETSGASTSGEAKLPDTIENMQKQITDIKEIPKSKDALIREIENRDKLMQEIGKVLDVTKHEIKKVQKQKEIISNLETELQRVKEEEFNKKLEEMIKTEGSSEQAGDLPEGVDSSMFLENILANVENLKKQVKSTKQPKPIEKMDIDEAALEFIESMPPTTEPPKMTDEEKRAKMAELLGGLLRGPKVKSTKLEENAKIIEQEIAEKKAKEAKPAKVVEKKETPAPAPVPVEAKPVPVKPPPKVEEKVEAPKSIAEAPKKPESPKKSPPAEKKSEQKSNKKDDVKKSPVKDHKPKDANKNVKKEVAPEVEAPKAPEAPEIIAKPEPVVVAAPKVEEVKPAEPVAVPVEPKKIEEPAKPATEPPKPQEPPKVEAKIETPAPEKSKPSAPDSPSQSKNQKRDSKKGKGSPKQQQQRSQKTSESKSEEKPIEKVAPVTPPSPAKLSLADIVKSQPAVEESKPPAEAAPKAEPEVIKTEATFEVVAVPATEAKVEAPVVEGDAVKPATETEQPVTDPKNVERSDFVSPANNQDGAKSLKSDDGKKQSPASKAPKKAPQKTTSSAANKTPQSPKPRPASSTTQKGPNDNKKPAAPKPTTAPAPVPAKETVVTEKKIDIPASEPAAPAPMKNGTAKSPSPTKSTSPAKKPDVPPKPEFLKNGTSTKSPVSTPRKLSSENVTKQKSPSPRPSVTSTTPTQTKKPSVPPRPAHLKSSKPTAPSTGQKPKSNGTTTPKTNNTTTPKTAPSAKPSPANKQTPTTFYCRPLLELANSEHEAFSEPPMDNKILDPYPSIIPTMSSHEERQQQQVKAMLTKDDIKILFPTKSMDESENSGPELKFLSKEVNVKNLEVTNKPATKAPIDLRKPINVFSVMNDDNDAEDHCQEFKFTARPVFMTTVCQHCKFSISTYFTCKSCQMVSYCKDEHLKMDSVNHKDLCLAIQGIAKKRGGHIFNMAGNLNGHEFKNLRIHTINLCEKLLNRQLKPFEREIFLYPRLCNVTSCREWRAELLSACSDCRQVFHCTAHEIPVEHEMWCESYKLYHKLVTRQSCYGRIEPIMPHRVLKQQHQLTGSIHDLWKAIYKNTTAFKDDCLYSTMTQVATGPLTALYGYQKSLLPFNEQFTIHLVGAELQFEGSQLDKWETFFLHLVPEISDLHIIFIGPELNVENLPVEIISRTRMCRLCRSDCRGVTFDFQCRKFYHDYCDSLNYSKPDLICFFNAGLYRTNSFKGFDTWPKTVEAVFHHHKNIDIPVIVTSSAEYEAPLDLQQILSIVQNCDSINVIQEPTRNPYASIKPERNFVNEEIAPLIFKNQFYFVVQSN